jgi:hypothetical protein
MTDDGIPAHGFGATARKMICKQRSQRKRSNSDWRLIKPPTWPRLSHCSIDYTRLAFSNPMLTLAAHGIFGFDVRHHLRFRQQELHSGQRQDILIHTKEIF